MAHRPFQVNVGQVRRTPGTRLHEDRSGPIEGLETTEARVPAGADVTVSADIEFSSGTSVMVHATVTAPWEGDCRRCLELATGTVAADVRELFEENHDPESSYRLHGDQLDLEPLARDAVLLELPVAPLCAADCRGLCATCGANLNNGACRCAPDTEDD